jgi:pimeloyl-ACP methyl ester carboxylesterase
MTLATSYSQAQQLENTGQLAGAADLYSRILREFPNHQDAQRRLSQIRRMQQLAANPPAQEQVALMRLFKAGEFNAVIQSARRLATRYPQSTFLWHILGGAFLRTAQLQQAEQALKTASELAPSEIKSRLLLAEVLNSQQRRPEAAAQLAEAGVEPALQSFFTQSLDIPNKRWKLNLDTLADQMPNIMSFPETEASWDGSVLFLSGTESDYVLPEHRDLIRTRFPAARFAKLPGAGHWLHAEKPREFEAAARVFLNA